MGSNWQDKEVKSHVGEGVLEVTLVLCRDGNSGRFAGRRSNRGDPHGLQVIATTQQEGTNMKKCSVLMSLVVLMLLGFFTLVCACATTGGTATDYSADETVECETWQAVNGGKCVDRCRPGERYAQDRYWLYLGRSGKAGVCVSTSIPYYAYDAGNGVTRCETGTIPVKEGYCASICHEGEKWENGCVSVCNKGDMWNLSSHRCETPVCTPPRAWNPETVDCECPPELVDNGKRCLIKKEAPPEPEPTKAPKGFSH